MGADGHIVICRKKDFKEANPDVEPSELYLYEGEFLGEVCCWGYYGDDGSNYMTPYDSGWGMYGLPKVGDKNYRDGSEYSEEDVEKLKAASEWFEGNAEVHEVWT